MDGQPAGGRSRALSARPKPSTSLKEVAVSKAEEIRQAVDALVAAGTERTTAFKQIAAEREIKYDSVRGAYYTAARGGERSTKPRRRETTPEDAIADARAALTRAIDAIDREVEAADARAKEATAEAAALKKSSSERKAEITKRLEALS
jgi:chromosome segregation ATPase